MAPKLTQFDLHVNKAYDELLDFMHDNREAMIVLAKGRHVEGHFRYGDALMYEYDQLQLMVEEVQEIADAVVYRTRRRQLDHGDGFA